MIQFFFSSHGSPFPVFILEGVFVNFLQFIHFLKLKRKAAFYFFTVFGFSYYTGKKKWKMWLYNPSGEFL